jgi:hypothetical protein
MTDEQIDRAIARHMGWKYLHKIEQSVSIHYGWCGINPETGYDEFIPDYCNDLNAMHKAEETLTGLLLDKYVDNCMAEVEYWPSHLLYLSARRRAEAFLQTIGKWEEV